MSNVHGQRGIRRFSTWTGPNPVRLLMALVFGVSAPVGASSFQPDDWSLERSANDPSLVHQRLVKLRRNPFDEPQWQALTRSLSKEGLAATIDRALSRAPDNLALRILDARASLAVGQATQAVE